ncbi:MAG TPA: HDOD domain-containing protein [Desulfobacteraceae bacterium]|nr:HDOD domain-containing protein [Desulfobacteraceae bacterium]
MDFLSEPDIKKVLRLDSETLPSFPAAATRLLELSRDDSASFEDFSKIIETDPGISVRVLEMVNSAMYGLEQKITVLSEAALFLGVDEIKKLAIGMSLYRGLFQSAGNGEFNRLFFWRHCLSVAVLSREIARETGYKDPEEAYLAGLLHDVGKIFLDLQGRSSYTDFVKTLADATEPVIQKERAVMGLGHDDIGAFFCSRWHLPEKIAMAVKYHHQPFGQENFPGNDSLLISIISLSDFFCWSQGLGSFDIVPVPMLPPGVEKAIDLNAIDIVKCMSNMNREIDSISQFYHFTFPSASKIKENLLWTNLKLSRINTQYYLKENPLTRIQPPHPGKTEPFGLDISLEFGKLLAKAKTMKEILDIIMYQVGRIFQPVHWSILLKDPKTGDMVFSVVVGANKKKLQGVKLPRGEGIAGHIMETGESVIVEDVAKDSRFSMRVDQYTGFKTESIIGTPLKTDEKVFGVIEIINRINREPFTSKDLENLSLVAEYTALAMEKFYYHQTLKNMATKDPLTRIDNRWSFEHALGSRETINKSYGERFSMVIIEITGLWPIVQAEGRPAGEAMVKKTAAVLKKLKQQEDTIYRYGEETFVLVLPHDTMDRAEAMTKKIARAFSLHVSAQFTHPPDIRISWVPVTAEEGHRVKEIVESHLSRQTSSLPEENGSGQTGPAGMENHLQPLVQEEQNRAEPDKKKGIFEKKVLLSGTFTHLKTGSSGHIWIKRLSLKGVKFTIPRPHRIRENAFLDISFTLDDVKRSTIERRIVVRTIQDNYAEADFYNPPPYDKNLGFYFMA